MGQIRSMLVAGAWALGFAAAPAAAITINAFVVFGDSNVDIGRADDPVPNDGIIPLPDRVAGRSSNGPIIPEYLAERVGVPETNFSFGGATAGDTNILGVLGNTDLALTGTLRQIDEYEATLAGGSADPNALFIVWAGSNDLYFADKNDQDAVDVAVASAGANLGEAVTRLSGLGAKEIVVATRTPRPVLSDAATPSAEANEAARNDAAGRQLNDVIRSLAGDLDAGLASNVYLFDDYAVIREIIAGSGSNGFTAYSDADAQFCVNRVDCATLINYDAAHKTSAVHSLLADRFIEEFSLVAAPVAVPLPAALWLMLAGLGGVAAVRWRPLMHRAASPAALT